MNCDHSTTVEWLRPNKKINSSYKDLRASTKDKGMHLVEQIGCVVLRLSSPRCNHDMTITANNWDVLQTQSQKIDQQGCVKWCYSTKTPAHTLLTWQKHYTGVGLEVIPLPPYSPDLAHSDFHLFHSLSSNIKELPFQMKMCSASCLVLKITRLLKARNRKITPALADCCK